MWDRFTPLHLDSCQKNSTETMLVSLLLIIIGGIVVYKIIDKLIEYKRVSSNSNSSNI